MYSSTFEISVKNQDKFQNCDNKSLNYKNQDLKPYNPEIRNGESVCNNNLVKNNKIYLNSMIDKMNFILKFLMTSYKFRENIRISKFDDINIKNMFEDMIKAYENNECHNFKFFFELLFYSMWYPKYGSDISLNSCLDILLEIPNTAENTKIYLLKNCSYCGEWRYEYFIKNLLKFGFLIIK